MWGVTAAVRYHEVPRRQVQKAKKLRTQPLEGSTLGVVRAGFFGGGRIKD